MHRAGVAVATVIVVPELVVASPHTLLEIRRVEYDRSTNDQRGTQDGMAPPVHGGVLSARDELAGGQPI